MDTEIQTENIRFKVVSQTHEGWNVGFTLDVSELLDQSILLEHLRKIKKGISFQQNFPESLMQFDGIVRKTQNDDLIDVVVRIKKQAIEKGSPQIHFKEGIAVDKTSYTHMSAFLDIYCVDSFDRPISSERVGQIIRQAGLKNEFVDEFLVAEKTNQVLKLKIPLKDILIAKGAFPDSGTDAELEFFFPAAVSKENMDEYYSSRRVTPGSLLCHKYPPTAGKNPGMNVLGQEIPPRKGLDSRLKAGVGAKLSIDENEITADADGIVVVIRTMKRLNLIQGTKEFPESIEVKVNEVLKIDGNQILDIATSQSVEIIGDLHIGSKIVSNGEVFISGNVESGTLIEALDDVTVKGSVRDSMLNSQANILVHGSVSESQVMTREQVIIKGNIKNSQVSGDTITADTAEGSTLTAQRKINLNALKMDESRVLSTLVVGMTDFISRRLKENLDFLDRAKSNLARIELLVGEEIVSNITAGNAQFMMMKFLAAHRTKPGMENRKQVDTFRKIIESIVPTKALLAQKEKENEEMLFKMSQESTVSESVISIREGITVPALVVVDNVEAKLEKTDAPASIRSTMDGKLVLEKN